MRGVRLVGLLALPPLAVYALGWFVCEGLIGLARADSLGISGVPTGVVAAAVPILLAARRERRATPSRVLCGLIPPRPTGYQSRADVQRRIASGRGVTVVYALTGTRGVGKSVEAAECARTTLAKGVRVAWINAESRGQIVAAFAEAADSLGLDTEGQTPEAAAARAVRALSDASERVLVVFDNVLDPAPVREFLPTGPRVRVIATTTEQAAAALGDVVDIGRFSREEARRFLAERTGLDVDGHAEELIEELDALPLALAHAAARIDETGQDFAGYLTDLRAFPVERVLPRATWDHYPRSVAAAVMLAARQAVGDDTDGSAWDVLTRLALLSPVGVPTTLLHDGTEEGRFACVEVLARLKAASLVGLADGGTIAIMHRLTQRVVREAADEELLVAAGMSAFDRLAWSLHEIRETSLSTHRDEYRLYLEQGQAIQAAVPEAVGDEFMAYLARLERIRENHLGTVHQVEQMVERLNKIARQVEREEELFGGDDPRVAARRRELESIRRELATMRPPDATP